MFTVVTPAYSIFFLQNKNEKESEKSIVATIEMDIFRYHIWKCKLEKSLPTVGNIFHEISDMLYCRV